MSEQQAKFIKVISFIGGFLGAAICVCLGLKTVETNLAAAVLLLILATVFLILVYPLYQIGKIVEALSVLDQSRLSSSENQEEKADEHKGNKESEALQTVPVNEAQPAADEKTVIFPIASESAAKPEPVPSEELTKEFSMTKQLNTHTGELIAVPSAAVTEPLENIHFFQTSSRPAPKTVESTVTAGGLHTAAVRYDGTVLATGQSQYGQCDVSAWRDIVSVCAGEHHTLGLRENGSVVAVGYNGYGQCNVADWRCVCALAAGTCHTVGLLENGRCVARGDNTYGQCDVSDWTDVIAIAANNNYTVGLRADGALLAVGADIKGNWDAFWGPITSIAAGSCHTIGLKADGTVVARGNNTNKQCETARWNKIVAIAAGNFHSVGLCEDGTVVATGHNGYGECDVETWTDVIAIAAGRHHTVGLTKSGNILAAGNNTYGQCTVADMSDIRTFGI